MHDLRKLEWDTEFFSVGIGSFRGSLNTTDVDQLRKFAKQERIKCVYWFADPDDALSAKFAQENGFRYVDTRMTFERKLEGSFEDSVVYATANHISDLVPLARSSHSNTRFFFDGNFDRTRCEDLYQLWLERSFEGLLANAVLVAERDSKAAGYVTVKVEETVAQIGLIAVADFAQGQGLGKTLVSGALKVGSDAGATITQSRNIGAQCLYVSCGFKPSSTTDIYHWWI